MEVQRDGPILVTSPEYCDMAGLMTNDQKYLHPENNKYIMRYLIQKPLGYALLLGSSRYPTEQPLLCVEKDLKDMEAVLKDGGWDVHQPHNGTTTIVGYEHELGKLKRLDLNNYSCFMFYFSGHGSKEGILLQPYGDCVSYKSVTDSIVNLRGLQGKPKIIIFDCCRRMDGELSSLGCDFATGYHDTIICYACSSNATSIALGKDGSVFTQNFAKKLQQFGREMSFVELLNQAKGETYHVIKSRFKQAQQPVSESGLNCQLLLKETDLKEADRKRLKNLSTSFVLVPLQNYSMDNKAPYMELEDLPGDPTILATPTQETGRPTPEVAIPMDTSLHEQPHNYDPLSKPVPLITMATTDSEPVRDHVTTGKMKFTCKHDVVSNISHLGQGHHVFLCYLPDPSSPYGTPDQVKVQNNLNSITRLHYDLTRHGFAVTSDLSLEDQQPMNVLQWYIRHIERCDHVILVCSPAFKELFTSSRPEREITDPKAERFLVYSSAIYAECERCVKRGVGKFIPVVLAHEWCKFELSVPLLFRSSHIYELCEEYPREFGYDNTSRHFERLVCRMVGINRAILNAPRPGAPMSFPSLSSADLEEMNRRKYLARAGLQREGYHSVPFNVGKTSTNLSGCANDTQTNNHTFPSSSTAGGGMKWRMTSGMQDPGYQSPATPSASLTAGLPSTEDSTPPHSQRHYVATHYAATPSPIPPSHPTPSQLPPPTHHPAPTSTTQTADSCIHLPTTPPPRELLVWLSDRIVQWRFLGRYLDVEEVDIDRIALENQNNIREQCFQMLKVFAQQKGLEGTCQRLGEALLQSEKNKHLFSEFCSKLNDSAV